MIPPEAKNEFLMVKNLLKPVKIADKSKEIRPEFEFETLKLRETKSGGDKIQENSDALEPEFARIQLRRTPTILENVEKNDPPKRAKSQRRKIERTENNGEKESRVRSASVPSKKSKESRETDNNNNGDDGLESIKDSTKDCFKENYQLEESAEKSLPKLEIPLTYQNVVEQQSSKNFYPPSENNGTKIQFCTN